MAKNDSQSIFRQSAQYILSYHRRLHLSSKFCVKCDKVWLVSYKCHSCKSVESRPYNADDSAKCLKMLRI